MILDQIFRETGIASFHEGFWSLSKVLDNIVPAQRLDGGDGWMVSGLETSYCQTVATFLVSAFLGGDGLQADGCYGL